MLHQKSLKDPLPLSLSLSMMDCSLLDTKSKIKFPQARVKAGVKDTKYLSDLNFSPSFR